MVFAHSGPGAAMDIDGNRCPLRGSGEDVKRLAVRRPIRYVELAHVNPGLIYNAFLRRIYPDEFFDNASRNIPLGRMGQPIDIANAILYLVSDEGGYMTGQTLSVNGGTFMF